MKVKNKAIDARNRKYSVEEFTKKFGTTPPKGKYNKRRAIKCTMVEKSKSNPGYYKYMITIVEKDGTVHNEPAYGKDMQSSLNRLIMKERVYKIGDHPYYPTVGIFVIWATLMGWPLLILRGDISPLHLLFSFTSIGIVVGACAWGYNYLYRGE